VSKGETLTEEAKLMITDPIVNWMKHNPGIRYLKGSIHKGKVMISTWEGSKCCGVGHGESLEEASASCCNDMQTRMLEPPLPPVDDFGRRRA
jgi:hypothetical protein